MIRLTHENSGRPLVSLVMPTYNTKASYLEYCFSSFGGCSDPRIELIIADDGSSEETVSALQRLAQQCTIHTELVRRTTNGGQNAARNTGISHAHGRFIAFLDSDDHLDMAEMTKVLDAIEANIHADMFLYNCATIDEHGEVSRREGAASRHQGVLDQHDVIRSVSELWCSVISRPLLSHYGLYEGIAIGEDLVSIVPIITHADTIIGVDAWPYQYVQHPDSIMRVTPLAKRMQIMQGLDDMFATYPDLLDRFHDELEWVCIWHLLFWEPLQVLRGNSNAWRYVHDLQQFRVWMKQHFPAWENNPYLMSEPDAQNTRFKLIAHGWYRTYLCIRFAKTLSGRSAD